MLKSRSFCTKNEQNERDLFTLFDTLFEKAFTPRLHKQKKINNELLCFERFEQKRLGTQNRLIGAQIR